MPVNRDRLIARAIALVEQAKALEIKAADLIKEAEDCRSIAGQLRGEARIAQDCVSHTERQSRT